jgi:hypothetical protein
MQGGQLRQMQREGRTQEARHQALMDIYGTPEEAARQEILGQQQARQFDMFAKSMDFLDNVYDTHGENVASEIAMRPEVSQNISPFVKPESLSFKRDRKGTVKIRFMPAQDMDGVDKDGNQITIKAETPVIRVREPDGKEYLIPETKTVGDVEKIQKAAGKADVLAWDKAARDTVMRLVGTTTASGIVIDPERQQETQIALSLLSKYQDKDVNTAATEALNEARAILQKVDPNKEIARTGKDRKTGKRVVEYTDGTRGYLD